MIITKNGKTLTILKNSLSLDALREYFTVGEIVPGYASNQKVLAFFSSESHGWSSWSKFGSCYMSISMVSWIKVLNNS